MSPPTHAAAYAVSMRAFGVIAIVVTAAGCVIQPGQPSWHRSSPAYQSTAPDDPQPQAQTTAQGQVAVQGEVAAAPPAQTLPPAPVRRITFNARVATARDLAAIDPLEQRWGGRLPSGDYWYDNDSGAAGRWGGPTLGILPPGLQLGGPMPANASGGGDGSVTGVFINGRELHPQDVQKLEALVGTVYQGRWFVDASGNFGIEGGLVLGNLYQ